MERETVAVAAPVVLGGAGEGRVYSVRWEILVWRMGWRDGGES
jgi:hypothetical protein